MVNIKYLIPQETDLEWGTATTTVGMQECHAGGFYPAGDHPGSYLFSPDEGRIIHEYQIVYIIKGRGWFASAHCERTEIQAGDAFLLFPGEWHNYAPDPATGWTEAWIGFTGHSFNKLKNEQFFSLDKPIFHPGVSNTLWDHYMKACSVAENQAPAYQQQLTGYVALILCTIYAKSQQPKNMSDSTLNQINQAKRYMNEHIRELLHMEDVAHEVGMGYSKFRKVFKAYTGFTPGNYFIRLKLEYSKELLVNKNYSCKEVAYEMGFDSVTYFHQIFHRICGITPKQFRRQVQT